MINYIVYFFLAFVPISFLFFCIALLRLFGVQDINNITSTFQLGGFFAWNNFAIPVLIKIAIIFPALVSILIIILITTKKKIIKLLSYI